jgi:integrase
LAAIGAVWLLLAFSVYPSCTRPSATPLLTKRFIERLRPASHRVDIYDRDLRGFAIRVHPSGRRTYRYKYIFDGAQRVITIGEHGVGLTTEQARGRAEVLRGQVRAGVDPRAEIAAAATARREAARRAISVAQLVDRWLLEGPRAAPNKRASSWAHDARNLRRHIVPLLGPLPAAALRRSEIEDAQRQIADGATALDERTRARGRAIVRGGPAVARSAIVSLSSCYGWAVAHELLADNPVRRVRKLAAARRQRFLTEPEAARLLQTLATMERERAAPHSFADAIRLLLLTGARKNEIAHLAWAEVDLDQGIIRLPPARSKTGAKTIMLNTPAIALLRARQDSGRYVFPSTRKVDTPIVGMQKIWARARARAGLADLRIHDLRHAFASFAAADGASLPLIAKALGHSQTSTTERYTHVGDDGLRQLSERVGATIVRAE